MSIDDFIILPKVKEAIELCAAAGYIVIVITNQRGVPCEIYNSIHEYMKSQLPGISAVYTCPHEDGECKCRKPLPGLFYQAECDFSIDKSSSWMIGDSESDIIAGQAYGVNTKYTNNLYNTIKEILE